MNTISFSNLQLKLKTSIALIKFEEKCQKINKLAFTLKNKGNILD